MNKIQIRNGIEGKRIDILSMQRISKKDINYIFRSTKTIIRAHIICMF